MKKLNEKTLNNVNAGIAGHILLTVGSVDPILKPMDEPGFFLTVGLVVEEGGI